jgi:hypothetical protein
MKYLFKVFVLFVLLLSSCNGVTADSDAGPSGYNDTTVNSAKTENLDVLCRVWGFVKYHHPVFEKGGVDIDKELFALLPAIADADKEKRNAVLLEWIDGFGEFRYDKKIYAKIEADTTMRVVSNAEWIKDTTTLGVALSEKLQNLRYAERKSNYYCAPTIYGESTYSNVYANFSKEKSYDNLTNPDYGYRLLAVFRFWNSIEYFFPNKYLTDQDWNEVLPEFIVRMADGKDGEYEDNIDRLVSRINDIHATRASSVFGDNRADINTMFVEDKIVVTENYPEYEILRGDIIEEAAGRNISETMEAVSQFESVSNNDGLGQETADEMLRTTADTIAVKIRRGETTFETTLPAIPTQWYAEISKPFPQNTQGGLSLLYGDIVYIDAHAYHGANYDNMIKSLEKAKAAIVDMREYPNIEQNFLGDMTNSLFTIKNEYVIFTHPVLKLPGYFSTKSDTNHLSKDDRKVYDMDIYLLVNEGTQSHGEYCTMIFQSMPNVTVIGSQTAGADGNVVDVTFPGTTGNCFSGLGVYYPDGGETQRVGVRIDHYIEPTVAGIAAGRDELLETAIDMIRNN